MTSIASQMKDLKRRGLQKVLQGMGIAEKTNDEANSQAYQNFDTLGNFILHFKQSVQSASTSIEKMTKTQSNVASNLQAYINSELSGDTTPPTGELTEFFALQDDSAVHSVMLQEVAERFYYACNDIANTVLQSMLHSLDELVIKPITRDEDQNAVTKELTEECRKLNLDYDAYRRAAANVSNAPGEQERHEAKVRAAKDRFEASSKKLHDHLALRNYNRSKLVVHTVLSLIQQYNQFFVASAALVQEATGVLTPLLEIYQMDEHQLMDILRLDTRPPNKHTVKDGASVPPTASKPRSPSPPHSPVQQKPAAKPVPPIPNQTTAKPTPTPTRSGSPPHSPPSVPRDAPGPSPPANNNINNVNNNNGNNNTNNASQPQQQPPPLDKGNPLLGDLIGDFTTSSTPAPPTKPSTTPSPSPATDANIFDTWQGVGGGGGGGGVTTNPTTNAAPFFDTSFPDIPTTSTPVNLNPTQPNPTTNPTVNPTTTSIFHDFEDFDFNKPAVQPLKPQAVNPPTAKPAPTSGFKPSPSPTYGVPPQPKPNYNPNPTPNPSAGGFYSKPPPTQAKPPAGGFNMPGGFPQPATGFAPGPGFGQPPPPFGPGPAGPGYGPQPTFPGSRPGGGFPNGTGNPYTNPPNAGLFVQQESDGLDPAIASKIRQWSERGGKKTELRGLISNLHEVLWPDSGWEQKSVISPDQVKKAYRQATLVVHPDKVSNCTEEQKIIAKRIFEILRESYEVFKKEQLIQ